MEFSKAKEIEIENNDFLIRNGVLTKMKTILNI